MKILKSMLTSPAGQFTLVALLVLCVAYGGKLYYDRISIPMSTIEEGRVEKTLDAAVEALETHMSALPEGKDVWPELAGWTPKTLLCGLPTSVAPEEANHPTWKSLGLDLSKPVHYQFLFYSTGSKFSMLARADFDCDGLYQIYRRDGEKGFTGVSLGPLQIENPGE